MRRNAMVGVFVSVFLGSLPAGVLLATICLAAPAIAGEFVPVQSEVTNPTYRAWQQELAEDGVMEDLAAMLNDSIALPVDVRITAAQCETANAFYSAEDRAILICFELIEEFLQGALELGWSEEDAERGAENATEFFFYHELGHALVHVLELPVTGREEDAVDQLSTWALVELEAEEGADKVLDAALAFAAWGEERAAAGIDSAFWDEHSLNEQRFFNLVCWVYGRDPGGYRHLVDDGYLPPDRAERCPGEWMQIERSWSTLLEPHLKG